MTNKLSRIIRLSDPKLPYKKSGEFNSDQKNTILQNCHWGALKLMYSELEFLLLVSKHIDINECLVVYIGAQPGWRLKNLFIKHFFPNIQMLLYDPRPFDIEESSQIIIKTGDYGWFNDDKIPEVLHIANGRKIIYISDIRLIDELARESRIYQDMLIQQKWGIMMDAEFMLLKFRMFFYEYSPLEVNFLDNNFLETYDGALKDKIIFSKNIKKHDSKNYWMMYLAGTIYTQLYSPVRSTETRLFVKKIKYFKNANKYSSDQQNKYKMKYYHNVKYESLLNYFNLITRNLQVTYKKSYLLSKYLPGSYKSYTAASEYYIVRKFLKFSKNKTNFSNILNKIILIYSTLGNKYHNNLVLCGPIRIGNNKNNVHKIEDLDWDFDLSQYDELIDKFIQKINAQFENLKRTKLVPDDVKQQFIKSFDRQEHSYLIKNGVVSKMLKK